MSDYPQTPPPPPSGEQPGGSAQDQTSTAPGWEQPRDAPAWDQPADAKGGNGPAVAALICGIVSLLLAVPVFPLGLVLGIAGLILGVVGLRRARHPAAGRKGMAVTGLITGVLGLLLSVVVLIGVLVLFNTPEFREPVDRLLEGEDPEEVLEDLQQEMEEREP